MMSRSELIAKTLREVEKERLSLLSEGYVELSRRVDGASEKWQFVHAHNQRTIFLQAWLNAGVIQIYRPRKILKEVVL